MVHLSQQEFDYWTDLSNLPLGPFTEAWIVGARRNLLSYRDRIAFVTDGTEVLPGIRAIATPGHSPGHFSYVIGTGPERYIFLGDVAHTSHLQLAHPDWPFAFDFDSRQAIHSRLALLERAAVDDLTLIG